jgi:hypothetical protein
MLRTTGVVFAFATVITLSACGSSGDDETGEITGPLMRPGEDCLSCHSRNSGRDAPVWSAAGTVFPSAEAAASEGVAGVSVHLFDDGGELIETLTTNRAGNFYTATPLPQGFRVALEHEGQRIDMPCPPPAGLCNACHNDPPIGMAKGRIFIPQGADPDHPPFDCTGF